MSSKSGFLENSVLIVAHPDDEILWFSSIVDKVDEVIICFEEVQSQPRHTAGRKKVLANYPLKNVSNLGLTESEVFNSADWESPTEQPYGLQVTRTSTSMSGFSEQRYKDNFHLLKTRLASKINGRQNVITHNPWGEYGHEEHVQVFRAVQSLKQDMGIKVWGTNYCSNKSWSLMLRTVQSLQGNCEAGDTNLVLARSIEALYKQFDCWTWFDNCDWCASENVMETGLVREGKSNPGRIVPLNFVDLGTGGGKKKKRKRNFLQRLKSVISGKS